ncbi:MAG: hypothetical protein ACO3G4_08115 [Opitutaceae bacterium]
MAGPNLQTTAFVLTRRPAKDGYLAHGAFSAEHGALHLLQRAPRGAPATLPALDLFDETALELEGGRGGRTWFVRGAVILRRHSGIGRGYETLRRASALATLIDRHPGGDADRRAGGGLLATAFAAFDAGARPDIVYLKALYRFARDEGHPVREQWFPTLPVADRATVAHLLNQPLAAQTAAPAEVERLLGRLEHYLRGHTEILPHAAP